MKTTKFLPVTFTVILISLVCVSHVNAQYGPRNQHKKDAREKIEAQKVAFITNRLDLTPSEAEKFWPVYNENRDKMEAERESFRTQQRPSPEDIDKLSDEEAIKLLNEQLDHEQKMLNQRKEFDKKLQTVLSPQKILKLHAAEQDFKIELMKKVAGVQGSGPVPGPGPDDF